MLTKGKTGKARLENQARLMDDVGPRCRGDMLAALNKRNSRNETNSVV